MAKLPVEVIDLRKNKMPDLSLAIEEANRVQEKIEFTILDDDTLSASLEMLYISEDIHTGDFFDALIQMKAAWDGYHPFIICFVDCALHSDKWRNLFSSRRAKKGSGVVIVTTHSVEKEIIPKGKMAAYFIYQLATHVLATLVSGKKHHTEIRNCIYDFHEQKDGIRDGISKGKLCKDCQKWFIKQDMSPSQIASIQRLLGRGSELLDCDPKTIDSNAHQTLVTKEFSDNSTRAFGDHVFIVHGHDQTAKQSIARFVEKFGLKSIILDEQANKGQTIIDKFEENADKARFAIVLLTPDDVGAPKDQTGDLKPRARQNVILELGYFLCGLGRERVCVLHKGGVEPPSDIQGIVYVSMNNPDEWQLKLAREMKKVGLPIDLNKLVLGR